MLFNISTVQEVAPTQLYKKKHDTKISMVGDTLLLNLNNLNINKSFSFTLNLLISNLLFGPHHDRSGISTPR